MLVFPSGTEIAAEIWRSLRWAKEVNLVGAGLGKSSIGPTLFERHDEVPSVYGDAWLEPLLRMIRERRIDLIFPAHDEAAKVLAMRADLVPCEIVGPRPSSVLVCRSKRRTYEALGAVIRTPRIFSADGPLLFPVFVKPDEGQGGKGARVVRDEHSLQTELRNDPNLLVCEYLPGPEYTIDCYTRRDGVVLYARARARSATKSGISVASEFVDLADLGEAPRRVSDRLAMRGPWFMQVKRADDGQLTLLEVGARVAGTMALSRATGANLPLLAVHEALGRDVALGPLVDVFGIRRFLANHYQTRVSYETVYVDLDDTLIVHGKVNPELAGFLVQAKDAGKRVVLVTRNARGIATGKIDAKGLDALFDEVRILPVGSPKSQAIRPGPAIFIDDSFAERREVHETSDIPVFDTSMVEALLDHRS